MVDTINPNTNQPDSLGGEQQQPAVADDRFYGGFDQPDETKINLVNNSAESSAPKVEQPATPTQPLHDVSPVTPAEVKHTSYVNTANVVNWRGVFVIVLVGLVLAAVIGLALYFGISASNNTKINEQQAKLDALKEDLSALKETPSPLELPQTETPETPSTAVTPEVTPTPVETPTIEVEQKQPDANTDNLG